jgi:predicted dehydrogenase
MGKFRVVVAGCGGMSYTWVDYALSRDDVEIVGLMDTNTENAKSLANKFELTCGIYNDLTRAIEDSEADLVFDVTVPEAHRDITIKSLALGCNVMGEKPMASSMDEAREMVLEARRHDRMYSVMQNRRYNKHIRALKGLVTSGAIGIPGFICADFFLGPHFGGFREIMDSPLVLDMAIHTFDQARFIIGADPVTVYCHEFNPNGSWYRGNASAVCIFEMSDGSVFCYRGSWCSIGVPTSWESSWRIMGSNGTAIWDGTNKPYAESAIPGEVCNFMDEVERAEPVCDWNGREGHKGCLDEMFEALIQGRKSATDCTDNIKSMAMVFGALMSSKSGKKVNVAELYDV